MSKFLALIVSKNLTELPEIPFLMPPGCDTSQRSHKLNTISISPSINQKTRFKGITAGSLAPSSVPIATYTSYQISNLHMIPLNTYL